MSILPPFARRQLLRMFAERIVADADRARTVPVDAAAPPIKAPAKRTARSRKRR